MVASSPGEEGQASRSYRSPGALRRTALWSRGKRRRVESSGRGVTHSSRDQFEHRWEVPQGV